MTPNPGQCPLLTYLVSKQHNVLNLFTVAIEGSGSESCILRHGKILATENLRQTTCLTTCGLDVSANNPVFSDEPKRDGFGTKSSCRRFCPHLCWMFFELGSRGGGWNLRPPLAVNAFCSRHAAIHNIVVLSRNPAQRACSARIYGHPPCWRRRPHQNPRLPYLE